MLSIAATLTYLPPTYAITLAYSFSAPMAVMVAVDVAAVWLDAEDEDDEQALASRTAATGRAAARTPERVRMALDSQRGSAAERRGLGK